MIGNVEAAGRESEQAPALPVVGRTVDVVGAQSRVEGTIDFALNEEVARMAHAKLLRSPYPHARIVKIDTTAAEQIPGVVAILTARDFDVPDAPSLYYGVVIHDQPVVSDGTVRFGGDPVAAVAAETEAIAEEAANAIEVEYETLPTITTVTDALADGAPRIHDATSHGRPQRTYSDIRPPGDDGNICGSFRLRHGDVGTAMAGADVVIENIYETPVQQHVAMEPHVVLAWFDRGTLSLISTTQAPFAVRTAMSEMFAMRSSDVRVMVRPLGGSYGAKGYVKFEPVAAALAWKARRPVKLVFSRAEEFLTITKHASRIKMRTGATSTGEIVAQEVQAYFNGGAYADISPRVVKNGGFACAGPYRIPNVAIDSYAVYTNLPPATAYRGYGVSQAAWAHEQQLDELADALGLDPLEIRQRNLLDEGDTFATGERMEEARWKELLNRSAKAIDWTPRTRSSRSGDRARGKGLAVVLKSTITPSTSHATVRVDQDGTVQVLASAVEMGQGAHTVLAQFAAEGIGASLDSVNVAAPDTQYSPYDQSTSSSRTTRAVGGAVLTAASRVRTKLLDIAANVLEANAEDLDLVDDQISVAGVPASALPISEVLWRSHTGSVIADGEIITEGGLDPETGQGIASDHWHQGAAGVEVEVDLTTGKVYVLNVHTIAYAGQTVNPKLARLQLEGSALFAISNALYEEMTFDDGHLTNPNLSDYSLASLGDLPPTFKVETLEEDEPVRPHGLGETTLPPVIAALGNAVAAATGRRVHRFPLTPERVLGLVHEEHEID